MLLNIHILAQEYLISFSLLLNTFKSFKFYLLRYRDITTLNCIMHSIEKINCDKKITLIYITCFYNYSNSNSSKLDWKSVIK